MTAFITWSGMARWVACIVWMHRISTRQDSMLLELRAIAKRIEQTARAEHELIKEVHPAVSEIRKSVAEVTKAQRAI